MSTPEQLSNFIWQIADLLRGPYRPPQYERVMLPLTVLRRFDCLLESTKNQVLNTYERYKTQDKLSDSLDSILNKITEQKFHNRSQLSFIKLKNDPDNIQTHLVSYINGFSKNVRDIFEYFKFADEIQLMSDANILYLVVSKFCDVDLHPDKVDNIAMGLIFQDLIRRFNEQANETAGDHFTPREVIHLMVDILFTYDDDFLTTPFMVRTMLDPTCGTGGMLAEAQEYLSKYNPEAILQVNGQDYNGRAYAVAASDMLIKGSKNSQIKFGDSLIDDKFFGEKFNYLIANPPFGVDWKKQQKEIVQEHEKLGFVGRFGAGLPRVNDGSLLFLQHMISKFETYDPSPDDPKNRKDGSRLAIVFNGSPLFSGGAGSGESNIRKWIIENDWLETIIALPEQMFYNTGIGTYIWIVTNRKEPQRKGKIQLIDARARWKPMRRSLGDKRRYLGEDDIEAIVKEYGNFVETETSKVFDNAEFGYTRVTIERPLRLRFQITLERKAQFLDQVPHLLDDIQAIDKELGREAYLNWNEVQERVNKVLSSHSSKWRAPEQKFFRAVFAERDTEAAPVILKRETIKGKKQLTEKDPSNKLSNDSQQQVIYEPDKELRVFESISLKENVEDYFSREVLPSLSDAWIDHTKDVVGYQINFDSYFYDYVPALQNTISSSLKSLKYH
ncbi:MAG: SAM-dependent DNA methyltransferase [Acidobacteria bacterium]|nr:SAM-dependent DNA methyltransferase [Acidobacteriota bacterium]